MKKIILIALALIMAISTCACARVEFGYDIDLTKEEDVYGKLEYYINNPDSCKGLNVKIQAESTVVYNFSENKIARHSLLVRDNDSDMRALYEFRSTDGKYPRVGSTVVLGGIFTDGYIDVKEYIEADFNQTGTSVNALSMTADQLKAYFTEFESTCNAFKDFGKTIKVYGNINYYSGNDTYYFYLNGFDAAGSRTWTVELKATGNITLPKLSAKNVNSFEIIGKLDMYMENHIAYPCISVTEIRQVEGILKVEEESIDQSFITPGQ